MDRRLLAKLLYREWTNCELRAQWHICPGTKVFCCIIRMLWSCPRQNLCTVYSHLTRMTVLCFYYVTQLMLYTGDKLSSSIFPLWVSVSGIGNTRPNLHFFQYIQACKHFTDPIQLNTKQYRIIMTQYHHVPTSNAQYWPSSTNYQPVPPHTDPVPPSTSHYPRILTQFHQVPTSTALYSPTTTK